MNKTLVALLLCLAGFSALAQAPDSGTPNKESPPAAVQQEKDSSTAQEVGRWIGAWMKRATDMLKDVGRGISEGFKSAPADSESADEPACSAEQAREGKCKPEPARKESEAAPEKQESSSLVVRLIQAFF